MHQILELFGKTFMGLTDARMMMLMTTNAALLQVLSVPAKVGNDLVRCTKLFSYRKKM